MKPFTKIMRLIALLIIIGCSSSTDNNDTSQKTKLKGVITQNGTAKKLASSSDINKLWVLPIGKGDLWNTYHSPHLVQTININPDGSFEVEFSADDTGANYVALLINTNESDVKDQVKGYVTVGFGSETMISLPTEKFKDNELDLDTLSLDSTGGDEFLNSDSTSNLQKFTLTQSQLMLLAKTDDMLKMVKNFYLSEALGIWAAVDLNFIWFDTLSKCMGQFSEPLSIAQNLPRYNISIISEYTDFNVSNLSLTAPSQVTTTYPTETQGTAFDVTADAVENNERKISSPEFIGEVPDGIWSITENGTEKFLFDVSKGAAFDNQGLPKILVPSLKVTTTGQDSTFESIGVEWYMYESGTYSSITLSEVLSLISNESLSIYTRDTSGQETELQLTNLTTSDISSQNITIESRSYISLGYSLNGVGYQFMWYRY